MIMVGMSEKRSLVFDDSWWWCMVVGDGCFFDTPLDLGSSGYIVVDFSARGVIHYNVPCLLSPSCQSRMLGVSSDHITCWISKQHRTRCSSREHYFDQPSLWLPLSVYVWEKNLFIDNVDRWHIHPFHIQSFSVKMTFPSQPTLILSLLTCVGHMIFIYQATACDCIWLISSLLEE